MLDFFYSRILLFINIILEDLAPIDKKIDDQEQIKIIVIELGPSYQSFIISMSTRMESLSL